MKRLNTSEKFEIIDSRYFELKAYKKYFINLYFEILVSFMASIIVVSYKFVFHSGGVLTKEGIYGIIYYVNLI